MARPSCWIPPLTAVALSVSATTVAAQSPAQSPETAGAQPGGGEGAATAAPGALALPTITTYATQSPIPVEDYPGQVTVIDRARIESLQPSSAFDLFEGVPGVQVLGGARRSGQSISVRGLAGEGVLILFDGARQSFVSGHDGRAFIDPSLVQAVEVVRGPGSALYGSGALGGVVAFRTVDAADFLAPGETGSGARGGVPNAETSVAAGFIQTDIRLPDLGPIPGTLTLIPALRYDRYASESDDQRDVEEDAVSPRVGVAYDPVPWLSLFANYAEGFRAPSFDELYATGTHFSVPNLGAPGRPVFVNNSFVGNPDLEPERSETIEIGLGVTFDRLVFARDRLSARGSPSPATSPMSTPRKRSAMATPPSTSTPVGSPWTGRWPGCGSMSASITSPTRITASSRLGPASRGAMSAPRSATGSPF